MKLIITEMELKELAKAAAANLVSHVVSIRVFSEKHPLRLYGIPRGGVHAAEAIMKEIKVPVILVSNPCFAEAIVDDLIDSGKTMDHYVEEFPTIYRVVLINKQKDSLYAGNWIVFPWEVDEDGADESATDIGIRLLQYIGENSEREGLKETPARFLKAWTEMTSGYKKDPKLIAKSFTDGADNVDEMVLLRHIPVESQCEHHMLRFWGWAHVAYIPDGKIMGLSKFNRLVDMFGRRLQVQERLTVQIADAIEDTLDPLGVGVVLECRHGCMEARGVQARGTTTVTSAMRGVFREQPETRAEFLSLARSDQPI